MFTIATLSRLFQKGNPLRSNKTEAGDAFPFGKHRPLSEEGRNSESERRALVILRQTNHEEIKTYSSPRRRGRRVVGFFLQSGQGETMPSVLGLGALAFAGHTQSSTFSSAMHPPSTTSILLAS